VRLSIRLALLGTVVTVVVLTLATGPLRLPASEGQATSMQQGEFALAIDANIENGNGPCDPIDDEAKVEAGATHRVAVCILNPPEPPYSFLTRVDYDDQLNTAPTLPAVLPALDENPDANAGETTFSDPSLGARWDCSGLGIYPPSGDDPRTPEKHDAVLACHTDLASPDTTLVNGGPLEVITFVAAGKGDDHLEFDSATEIGGVGGTIGTCGLVPAQQIPCNGAVLHNAGGGPAAVASPAASPSGSPAASAGTLTPQATQQISSQGPTPAVVQANGEENNGGGGGFPWPVLGGAVGGAALLLVVVLGLYAWRASSKT
jgi:hypothetical protein